MFSIAKDRYKLKKFGKWGMSHHHNSTTQTTSSARDLEVEALKMRVAMLETENQELKDTNAQYETQVQRLVQVQQSLQKVLSGVTDKKTIEEAMKLPLKVGLHIVTHNQYTQTLADYLKSKFSDKIEQYDENQIYDLVLVIFYRSSASLDRVMSMSELEPFSNLNNCWFICAHGSVWDDRCDYKDLIEKYNVKDVVQFNIWNNAIQTRHSPTTVEAMKRVDSWVSIEQNPQKTFGEILTTLSSQIRSKLPMRNHNQRSSI